MKRLLSLLGMLIVALSTFAQTFTVDGLTYSVLSETDKTVQLTSGVTATGDVVVPTSITVPASQVLDVAWTTQSGPDWTSSVNEAGKTVYKSGIIGDDESTVLRCTFRAKGTIAFMCRFQGEESCDYLTIGDYDAPCTRDSYSTSLCGNPNTWTRITINVSDENEHYIEFCYSKDGSAMVEPDCAEVYIGDYEGGEFTVASISNNCTFKNNTAITSITIPESCTEFTAIPSQMFYGCTSLKSFSIPTATSIGSSAFEDCTSLTSANLPAATSIGDYAFQNCSSLTSANLRAATSIESSAFNNCLNVNSLRIGSVEQWCNVQFDGYCSNPLQYTSKSVELFIDDSEIPATSIEVPNTVTKIPDYAFRNTTITSLYAPTATSIGSDAFKSCTSLTSASLPAATSIGSSAFERCTSLTSASLPAATSIDDYAFYYCTSLTSASLLAATSIGEYAFRGCESLEKAIMPSVKTIGYAAFPECPNVCSLRIGSVEQWCNVQFDGYCSNPLEHISKSVDLYIGDSETPVTTLEVPSTVSEIPLCAFRNTTITSVSALAVISIGDFAFDGCNSLISANFPAATSIKDGAFKQCTSLTSVNLPVTISIGRSAFSNCTSLTLVNIPLTTSIDIYAYDHCTSLTSIELPAAISIGTSAFSNCTSLTSANLPVATSIGSCAFQGCTSLTSIEFPAATSIDYYAFRDCSSLASINLCVATSIGSSAFSGCCNINSLRIGSVEQWCNVNFGDPNSNPLYVPNKFVDLYVGDSDSPATELSIPATVQQIPTYFYRGDAVTTIHFKGVTPPALLSTSSFPEWSMLAVPEEAYETYLVTDVYNTIPLQITKEGLISQDITIEADNTTSKLLEKIGEDEVRHVVNLKITGSINSYDMLIIRNQMTSLRNLDLTDAYIVDCDYVYSNADGYNYHSVKNEITGDWLMGLMNVKLPANTKSIGYGAFSGCSRLVSVNIPDGVASIGSCAFYGCNRIKKLTLPPSAMEFGEYAFYDCTGLKEVVIPDGVTSINSYAFEGCKDLENVTIPSSVKNIGHGAFSNVGNGYWDEYGIFHRNLFSLRISDVDSWMDVEIGYVYIGGVFDNVGRLYVGDSNEPVENIVIPAGTTELKRNTFSGFRCLKSVLLPDELISIGDGTFFNTGLTEIKMPKNLEHIGAYAFSGCTNMENVEFANNLKYIGEYAFSECNNLKKIELPAHLETISNNAFADCVALTEVLIPASIQEIGDYAFQSCYNLKNVIATTVEPIRINQNTFSTYQTATVYSPKTSYYKYYWNTQWNQFLARKEYDKEFAKTFGYKYFYLNGQNGDQKEDFEISDETGPLHGVGDDNPDADFNEGAGMIVGGEQVQELGDIHIHHNGNNGASVITKQNGKVHIDNLYVDIKTQPNRWYFFCFPFDIQPGEASFDGSYVWYLYDGEARAQNGNGGWKKVASDGVMKAGNGYIFQGAVNGTLTIHVQDVTIDGSDAKTNMITYQSDNKNDASWNLIGNPNIAYYDINNLGYEAPVTVYNNATGNYEAVRPGDDQYEFYPFQAFFVQKPEGVETMDFDATKKDTKNKSDEKKKAKAAMAKGQAKSNSPRKVINLELASTDTDEKATDRTRIVVNPMKTTAYETDCDAAKFIADNMPQIYSRDAEGCTYAINERPVENGIIDIVVKATKDSAYTISAPRLDYSAKLRDLEADTEVDLAEGAYTFMAEAKTYTNRFQLILAGSATGIMTPEEAQATISVEAGAINITDSNADVKVYSVGGSLVKAQNGAGTISVPTGTYVVNVNGQSVKVNVND